MKKGNIYRRWLVVAMMIILISAVGLVRAAEHKEEKKDAETKKEATEGGHKKPETETKETEPKKEKSATNPAKVPPQAKVSRKEEPVADVPDEKIKSTEVVENDVSEEVVDGEKVKVIYKTPESCKEFTLYLDDLAATLLEKEKNIKHEQKVLEQMKKDMEALTKNFVEVEKRVKTIVQYDSGELQGNPQLAKMIKLYETFSAEEAAARLKNLDLDLTMAILKGMQPKKLGKILSVMDPKLSAALSSRIVRGF